MLNIYTIDDRKGRNNVSLYRYRVIDTENPQLDLSFDVYDFKGKTRLFLPSNLEPRYEQFIQQFHEDYFVLKRPRQNFAN
jgi:hypothetical protein